MVALNQFKWMVFLGIALVAALTLFAPAALAAEEGAEGTEGAVSLGEGLKVLGIALGAGIAVAGAGLGTARAQAAVGAGGTGAMAEKPELFTSVLILFAIPETIIILGFVIAFLLLGSI